MLLLNSNQYKVIDIFSELKFWLQNIINLSLERFPFKMSITSRQPFFFWKRLVSSKTKGKKSNKSYRLQVLFLNFLVHLFCWKNHSANNSLLSRLLCEFQKCWLVTAISFIVVQLTHIIHTITVMQSQSQNVCKCFQTQKYVIRNSHCLEKLLGRLPCSPTMNTWEKERHLGCRKQTAINNSQASSFHLLPFMFFFLKGKI